MNERDDYSLEDEASSLCRLRIPEECAGQRLDQALARLFPEHSRSRLQAWLKAGRVMLDGTQPDARHRVHGGEQLEIDLAPAPEDLAMAAEPIPLAVVYEDDAILVIDKPAGLVVHPGSGNWSGTLLNALLHHAPSLGAVPRAGIVHRLDKDTSGLLVVAKTLPAQTDLIRQLQARTVSRRYLALVQGVVDQGARVDAPIGRHPVQRTRMAVVSSGKEAATRYRVRERFRRCTLVECELETGRTHQIRVHMAHAGFPLVGDPVYGARRNTGDVLLDGFPRQALHAWRLGLNHPVGRVPMSWESALPGDFSALLATLRLEEGG
ncbi:23S rRNA pseudouridine(1911/1915/1917) synthase RluD [Pseudothauera nasutitermitis]|uniref:23S rRNA pseudouridine(1911/1915/1917) synthase RluD n=1 Tax=Pseudothauera nasutitermitis TaxID=2565930 RepID=UPI001E2B9114|nr:23S rRNA pseudouridine(1911/1915/1917) synthase RluD [Pseudothauera nasutitermitis]